MTMTVTMTRMGTRDEEGGGMTQSLKMHMPSGDSMALMIRNQSGEPRRRSKIRRHDLL
jgi:hypothetical protein